jgi:hypothetical protein
MLLLLPIKEYSEGPVEIRGGSSICTRKVLGVYVESPLWRTRKVFGFCTVSQVFVGNIDGRRRWGVRGRSKRQGPAHEQPRRGVLGAYSEGPNPRISYAEGLVWSVRIMTTIKERFLYAEGPTLRGIAASVLLGLYAEGPGISFN